VRICYRRWVRGGGTAAAQRQYHKLYSNDKKANNRSISSPQIKLTLLLIILFIHGCSQILSLPDLLEREEWDKETPELQKRRQCGSWNKEKLTLRRRPGTAAADRRGRERRRDGRRCSRRGQSKRRRERRYGPAANPRQQLQDKQEGEKKERFTQ
jgi:hypothetical protein